MVVTVGGGNIVTAIVFKQQAYCKTTESTHWLWGTETIFLTVGGRQVTPGTHWRSPSQSLGCMFLDCEWKQQNTANWEIEKFPSARRKTLSLLTGKLLHYKMFWAACSSNYRLFLHCHWFVEQTLGAAACRTTLTGLVIAIKFLILPSTSLYFGRLIHPLWPLDGAGLSMLLLVTGWVRRKQCRWRFSL